MTTETLVEQRLRQVLEETAAMLDAVGEASWSARLREAGTRATLEPSEITRWYGGMGSFSDLVIARINGHRIDRAEEATTNQRLKWLREKIYELATKLR